MEKTTFTISEAIEDTMRMIKGTIHRHRLQIEINLVSKKYKFMDI